MNPVNNQREIQSLRREQYHFRFGDNALLFRISLLLLALTPSMIGASASAAPPCDALYCLQIWAAGATGQSSGGAITLSGSLSQSGSGAASTGGQFTVSSGFWAAVNTTPSPTLTATPVPTAISTPVVVDEAPVFLPYVTQ